MGVYGASVLHPLLLGKSTMNNLSRRGFLKTTAAVAAGVTAGSWASTAHAATPTRPFVAYSTDSYFRSRVGSTTIDQTRTKAFQSFMKTHPDQRRYAYPRINGVAGNKWGTPYALGTASDPIWKLTGSSNSRTSVLGTKGFHAPEWLGKMLTGTTDSPLCVIDVASGFTVFCADARLTGTHTISGSAGAITYHSSNGLDYRNRLTNDTRNCTSRGRISDAMVIRKDLVDYGVAANTDLGHVLHMFLVETRTSDGYRHPMTGAEKNKFGFGAEGERIAIAPSVDLTKRGLSPEALVIARTLQNYGCYFGDNSGSESCLKAEQENTARPVWNGRLGRDALKGITWDDFVVLK